MTSLKRMIWQAATHATALPTLVRSKPSDFWQRHWREKIPQAAFPKYAEPTPLKKWFAQRVVEMSPASVLELGCNVGANLREINALDPSIKLMGIELNEHAIAWGRQNVLAQDATVTHGSMADAAALFPDGADVIFTSAAAMHCDDQIFAATKAAALLKAQKAIVHLEFNAWCPADLHNGRRWRSSFLSDRWIRDYAGEYAGNPRVERVETVGVPLSVNFMDNIGKLMVSDVTGLVIVHLKPLDA